MTTSVGRPSVHRLMAVLVVLHHAFRHGTDTRSSSPFSPFVIIDMFAASAFPKKDNINAMALPSAPATAVAAEQPTPRRGSAGHYLFSNANAGGKADSSHINADSAGARSELQTAYREWDCRLRHRPLPVRRP
jgi:hypothetical protein